MVTEMAGVLAVNGTGEINAIGLNTKMPAEEFF